MILHIILLLGLSTGWSVGSSHYSRSEGHPSFRLSEGSPTSAGSENKNENSPSSRSIEVDEASECDYICLDGGSCEVVVINNQRRKRSLQFFDLLRSLLRKLLPTPTKQPAHHRGPAPRYKPHARPNSQFRPTPRYRPHHRVVYRPIPDPQPAKRKGPEKGLCDALIDGGQCRDTPPQCQPCNTIITCRGELMTEQSNFKEHVEDIDLLLPELEEPKNETEYQEYTFEMTENVENITDDYVDDNGIVDDEEEQMPEQSNFKEHVEDIDLQLPEQVEEPKNETEDKEYTFEMTENVEKITDDYVDDNGILDPEEEQMPEQSNFEVHVKDIEQVEEPKDKTEDEEVTFETTENAANINYYYDTEIFDSEEVKVDEDEVLKKEFNDEEHLSETIENVEKIENDDDIRSFVTLKKGDIDLTLFELSL